MPFSPAGEGLARPWVKKLSFVIDWFAICRLLQNHICPEILYMYQNWSANQFGIRSGQTESFVKPDLGQDCLQWLLVRVNGPCCEKTCLLEFANNTGADQPARPCSLISPFVIHFYESIICKLAAPNKGTTILYWFRPPKTVLNPPVNGKIQGIFKWPLSVFQVLKVFLRQI